MFAMTLDLFYGIPLSHADHFDVLHDMVNQLLKKGGMPPSPQFGAPFF